MNISLLYVMIFLLHPMLFFQQHLSFYEIMEIHVILLSFVLYFKRINNFILSLAHLRFFNFFIIFFCLEIGLDCFIIKLTLN